MVPNPVIRVLAKNGHINLRVCTNIAIDGGGTITMQSLQLLQLLGPDENLLLGHLND